MAFSIGHRRTLNRELDERAQQPPDKPFLIFQPVAGAPVSLTYAGFAAQVNRTANALLALDVRAGDKLLLVLGNCPEFLLVWFGAARIGAVIVPVNPLSSDAELEYLAAHSEAVLVVVPAAEVAPAERLGLRSLVVRGAAVGEAPSLSDLL